MSRRETRLRAVIVTTAACKSVPNGESPTPSGSRATCASPQPGQRRRCVRCSHQDAPRSAAARPPDGARTVPQARAPLLMNTRPQSVAGLRDSDRRSHRADPLPSSLRPEPSCPGWAPAFRFSPSRLAHCFAFSRASARRSAREARADPATEGSTSCASPLAPAPQARDPLLQTLTTRRAAHARPPAQRSHRRTPPAPRHRPPPPPSGPYPQDSLHRPPILATGRPRLNAYGNSLFKRESLLPGVARARPREPARIRLEDAGRTRTIVVFGLNSNSQRPR